MARDHARVLTAIWSDDDFVDLPSAAQRMYLLLLSQDELTYAGGLDLRPVRWASRAPDTSPEDVWAALSVLEAAGFVVLDAATEELLIRSYLRVNEVWKQPKLLTLALRQVTSILSRRLRHALREELLRLPDDYRADPARTLAATLPDTPGPTPPRTHPVTPLVTPAERVAETPDGTPDETPPGTLRAHVGARVTRNLELGTGSTGTTSGEGLTEADAQEREQPDDQPTTVPGTRSAPLEDQSHESAPAGAVATEDPGPAGPPSAPVTHPAGKAGAAEQLPAGPDPDVDGPDPGPPPDPDEDERAYEEHLAGARQRIGLEPPEHSDAMPPDRCPVHRELAVSPPCGRCARWREAQQRWKTDRDAKIVKARAEAQAEIAAERAAERAAIDRCDRCNDRGVTEHGVRCGHTAADEVLPPGRAAAKAEIEKLRARQAAKARPADDAPPASGDQLRKLAIAFGEHGTNDRDERLAWCSRNLGRDVSTTTQLSKVEASKLIDLLERPAPPDTEPDVEADTKPDIEGDNAATAGGEEAGHGGEQPDTEPDSGPDSSLADQVLAEPCGQCGHVRRDHQPGGGCLHRGGDDPIDEGRCDCPEFEDWTDDPDDDEPDDEPDPPEDDGLTDAQRADIAASWADDDREYVYAGPADDEPPF